MLRTKLYIENHNPENKLKEMELNKPYNDTYRVGEMSDVHR